jgi:hypothetical protein
MNAKTCTISVEVKNERQMLMIAGQSSQSNRMYNVPHPKSEKHLSRCTSRNGHWATFFAPVCPVRSGVNTTMVGVRTNCGWKNSLIPVGTTQSRIQQAVVFRVSEPGSSIRREKTKEEAPFAWNQSGKISTSNAARSTNSR